jgi:hypothetical protein
MERHINNHTIGVLALHGLNMNRIFFPLCCRVVNFAFGQCQVNWIQSYNFHRYIIYLYQHTLFRLTQHFWISFNATYFQRYRLPSSVLHKLLKQSKIYFVLRIRMIFYIAFRICIKLLIINRFKSKDVALKRKLKDDVLDGKVCWTQRCVEHKGVDTIIFRLHVVCGLGSVVGIATGYGLDGPGIETRREARFSAPVQTGPGPQPASCTMVTGFFPRG